MSDRGRDVVDQRLRQQGARTAADPVGEQRADRWEDDETADLGLERLEATTPDLHACRPLRAIAPAPCMAPRAISSSTSRELTVEERELDARRDSSRPTIEVSGAPSIEMSVTKPNAVQPATAGSSSSELLA